MRQSPAGLGSNQLGAREDYLVPPTQITSLFGYIPSGSRATCLVVHRNQDGEIGTGFRQTASEGSLLLRSTETTAHPQCVDAEIAWKDTLKNTLKEDCMFVTTRSFCMLCAEYTLYRLLCQIFILFTLLLIRNKNIFCIEYTQYEHFKLPSQEVSL